MWWSHTSIQATNKKNKLLESSARPMKIFFFFLWQDSHRRERSCCKDSEWTLREILLGGWTVNSLDVGSIACPFSWTIQVDSSLATISVQNNSAKYQFFLTEFGNSHTINATITLLGIICQGSWYFNSWSSQLFETGDTFSSLVVCTSPRSTSTS